MKGCTEVLVRNILHDHKGALNLVNRKIEVSAATQTTLDSLVQTISEQKTNNMGCSI